MFSILLYEPPDVRRFQANLPAWEYHALRDSLTASQLKELDKSPAHYQAYLRGQVRYESKAIELGSRVHLLLESPIEFYRKFAERPDGFDGRKTECKALAAAAKAEGVTLLDLDDWLQIHAIVTAYESSDDPLVRIVRESEGQNEISVFWNEQGHAHRCRPDRLVSPSTADCEWLCETYPSLFSVPFGTLAASHYLAGTQADAFIWIALETNPPYTVVGYLMSSVTRATNDERRRFLLQQLHECQATNDWPGLVLSDEERLI